MLVKASVYPVRCTKSACVLPPEEWPYAQVAPRVLAAFILPITRDGFVMSDRPAPHTRPRGWTCCLPMAFLVIGLLFASGARGSDLRQTPIVKALQGAKPSVVNIRGEKTVATAATQPGTAEGTRRVNGMGTGVIIDPRGYVLTNYHVVDAVREIQVTTADGKRFVATLVARDLETDLAVIKLNPSEKLTAIIIGTSSDLMPGETVIAVGNAYGYENTASRGIISALHRAVQVSDAQFYDDLIQTDAPINPGNSGGPLLNIDGETIGINVAVRAGAQNIGFAIPIDKAMAVAANLLGSTAIVKAWHGAVASADAPTTQQGMVVASVEKKSPAADGGLQAGDVITAVGDAEVKRALDFQRAMLDRRPGEKIQLTVKRGSEPVKLSLSLAELPDVQKAPTGPAWEVLGLELRTIPSAEFRQKHQTRYRGGLTVLEVRPNSPAAEQGIRRGDVLVGMHIWETISLDNVAYILKRPDFASLNPVKFFILRGNETLYGYLAVAGTTLK
jgi:serine protease Do